MGNTGNLAAALLSATAVIATSASAEDNGLHVIASEANQYVIAQKTKQIPLTMRVDPKVPDPRIGNVTLSHSLLAAIEHARIQDVPIDVSRPSTAPQNPLVSMSERECADTVHERVPASTLLCLDANGNLTTRAKQELDQFLEDAELVTARVVSDNPLAWKSIEEEIAHSEAVLVDIQNVPPPCADCDNYALLSSRPFK